MYDHIATNAEVQFVRNIGNWTLDKHRSTTSKLNLLKLYAQSMKLRRQWAGINPRIVYDAIVDRERVLRGQL